MTPDPLSWYRVVQPRDSVEPSLFREKAALASAHKKKRREADSRHVRSNQIAQN